MMICSVVGARPNYMKIAPVVMELARRGRRQMLVHTGQHYDLAMSDVFFDDLGMPRPDEFLGAGSGSHAEQTARVMMAFETVCLEHRPDLVIVGGDVNSTLACALVAAKLGIAVAHVEAGLRSFDRTMPEEINRVLTDHISDLLFASEQSGVDHLLEEGIDPDRVHMIGNCMIDSLMLHLETALARKPWEAYSLDPGTYGVITLHRPAVVDDETALGLVRVALCDIGRELPLVFPVHPRTKRRLVAREADWNPVRLVDPLGYLDFLGLMAKARIVLTDSGGIQEETTALGIPCVTMRENTERPVTIELGTNRLAGTTTDAIVAVASEALSGSGRPGQVPPLWDGAAARRAVDIIESWERSR